MYKTGELKMKKTIFFALSIIICLSLAGCGGSSNDAQQNTEGDSENEETQSIEVDEGLLNVEIIVPADFLEEGTTQEALDETAKEEGIKSITLNDDGSATYIMSKSKHDEMMAGIRESIDESMAEMIDPETYPTFVEVTSNDDYTHFTVKLSTNEVGISESVSVLGFYVLGGLYNAFNGTPVDDVTVSFVNADTGDIIQEAHSSEMAD
jgi:hypothetical protein|nr:MAG TPA: lipoprotein [Caudoviricetes sp.]